jgi:hypothetical protein
VTNTGKPYEALAEQVFKRLLAQDKLVAEVERDVVIEGRSTKHQVDVTFEFSVGGVAYRTIVQCKDWASAVKQEQVLAFHSVLQDIPGQPRGIMVSRSGFQAGAKDVAEHHGIKLYELREPHDEDWDGLLRRLNVTIRLRAPDFQNVRFCPDVLWVQQRKRDLGLGSLDVKVEFNVGDVELTYESGAPCDLQSILNQYVPQEPCVALPIRHEFNDDPLLVTVTDSPIGLVRIVAVEAQVSAWVEKRVIPISLDHLVAYCFRDVLAKTSVFLKADGTRMEGQ